MKSLRNFSIPLLVLLLATAGCDEQEILQEVPLDFASPENSFVTINDFNSALFSLYDLTRLTLSDGEHRPLDYIYGTDLGYNGAQQLNVRFGSYPATLTPNSDPARFHWQQYYKIISSANIILSRVAKSKLTAAQQKLIEAKAKLFRGHSYRNLAHLYGGVPIELEAVSSPKTDYTRATREQVYQQAATDLEFAAANLPGINQVKDGEITNLAAQHILAEVYISLKRYPDAIKAASVVIDDPNTALMQGRFGSRSGEPGDVYWDLFRRFNQNRGAGNTEGIWVFQYEVDVLGGVIRSSSKEGPQLERDCAPRPYAFPYKDPSGQTPFLTLGVSDYTGGRGIGRFRGTDHYTYGIWGYDWNDMRNSEYNFVRDVLFNNPKSSWFGQKISDHMAMFRQRTDDTIRNFYPYQSKVTTPGQHPSELFVDPVLKTLNASATGTTYTDQYLIRLAETYLLRAEANLGAGNLANAAADINVVRARAKAKLVTAAEVNIDFILDERMRELGVEEKRRLTLNRLGLLYERTRKYCNGHPTAAKFGVDVAPHNNLFPIPFSEIERNTGAVLQQNPGYASK
ncbi:RagB/SusD family nutrient uptake outer membrane protein [Persicitalea sp.]|uniref:RagB/SusD family nutrient uptake outer membrane protein n=1 Tax=Persicitalea sp. TaxID=3100273 RepID=UPI003592ECA8